MVAVLWKSVRAVSGIVGGERLVRLKGEAPTFVPTTRHSIKRTAINNRSREIWSSLSFEKDKSHSHFRMFSWFIDYQLVFACRVHVETSAEFFNSDGTNLRTSNMKFNAFRSIGFLRSPRLQRWRNSSGVSPKIEILMLRWGSGAGGIRIPVTILAIDQCSSHEGAL